MSLGVIVHGGAWSIPEDQLEPHSEGCREAVLFAWDILSEGGSALDAVEGAIARMEDDPTFNAGTGSSLNADGQVEMDAGIMDGSSLAAGAVAAVHVVRNPIVLSRRVLESEHILIAGPGATRFAKEVGVPDCSEADLVVERERDRWLRMQSASPDWRDELFGRKDFSTVGAVAFDRSGRVASGTSTGGGPNKRPGRVGDVPLIGCGFYADASGGGASCTGWGEGIARISMARQAVDFMSSDQPAEEAARKAVGVLADRVQGVGGVILIDREGRIAQDHNTEHMAYAYLKEDMAEPVVEVG